MDVEPPPPTHPPTHPHPHTHPPPTHPPTITITPTPAHQVLLHEVIAGLRNPSAPASRLFESELWDQVRSTAPLCSWINKIRKHGLVSTVAADDLSFRSTGPIWDLVALGRCPEVSRALLQDLVMWLAPYLRTVQSEAASDRAAPGPILWSPIGLTRSNVEFHYHDDTAGVAVYGRFCASTKDGLVRIMEGSRHVGTISQGRWNLLTIEYEPEEMCAALPGWIAQVEKEETAKGVPSAQFWKEVKTALDLDCVFGCSPLVAPSSFPRALNGPGEGWGFNLPPSSCIIYNLLHLSAAEQWLLCQSLRADRCWYALTRGSTLDHRTKARLISLGMVLKVFRRGVRAAAAKGCWRLAKLKTVRTAQDWTLWVSRGAAGSAASQDRLKLRLGSIHLTEDGVVPLDLLCPSAREVMQGPMAAAYTYEGLVVATDGSLKHDGSMGAAFVALGNRVAARSVAVFGSEMSVRPELSGIALALEYSLSQEDLAILTDSKASMDLLRSMQREDFPLWLYRHPARQLLVYVARLINQRAANGVVTRLVKVKAHAGDPLNEAADTLASAAAESDPSRSQDVDPEGVYFGYRGALVPWNSRLRRELTQVAAAQWAAKCVRPITRSGQTTPRHVPLTTSWMLRPNQGRKILGAVLSRMKAAAAKRQVLQSLAGMYPGNALLFKWGLKPSPMCTLCNQASETQAHIQCVCPALKGERIRVHHGLAELLWGSIERATQGWSFHREATVVGLSGIAVPMDAIDEWQRMCDELADEDLVLVEEDTALSSSIRRKRPDAWAVHWGHRVVFILEFTRPNDGADDWQTRTDVYKEERYAPLKDKLAGLLPGWKVETIAFSLGIRGSFNEEKWRADLERLKVPRPAMDKLMQELVAKCLVSLGDIYRTRQSALRE